MTKGMKKYFQKKIFWFIVTFIAAVILNFILPRLMPGDPVNAIVGKNISPSATAEQVQEQIAYYKHQFGLDKSLIGQFGDFVKHALDGTFGVSYSQYPRTVSDIIGSGIWWTVALQLPAILVGWILGNLLGALAAYRRGVWDKVFMPVSLFFSAVPAFGAAVILLVIFAVKLGVAPVNGAYDPGMIPAFNWTFIKSVISHYQLPFWSIVLISIGGQAVGMRSMSIYELN
ncbi:MAG: ABC transporter permease, partial [Oscillospiraceae bacterium]|nr:ABC transporter permease [Oscillospiraceae bacterium]